MSNSKSTNGRQRANLRERGRVRAMRKAFEHLAQHIPIDDSEVKLSQYDIVCRARDFIRHLQKRVAAAQANGEAELGGLEQELFQNLPITSNPLANVTFNPDVDYLSSATAMALPRGSANSLAVTEHINDTSRLGASTTSGWDPSERLCWQTSCLDELFATNPISPSLSSSDGSSGGERRSSLDATQCYLETFVEVNRNPMLPAAVSIRQAQVDSLAFDSFDMMPTPPRHHLQHPVALAATTLANSPATPPTFAASSAQATLAPATTYLEDVLPSCVPNLTTTSEASLVSPISDESYSMTGSVQLDSLEPFPETVHHRIASVSSLNDVMPSDVTSGFKTGRTRRTVERHRVSINKRLRTQSKSVREGVDVLREFVPIDKSESHLTTSQLLHRASYYITFLSEMAGSN